jgi:hypothetical protein
MKKRLNGRNINKAAGFHKKLYKSGKLWVAAGLTVATVGAVSLVDENTASADDTTASVVSADTQVVPVDATVSTAQATVKIIDDTTGEVLASTQVAGASGTAVTSSDQFNAFLGSDLSQYLGTVNSNLEAVDSGVHYRLASQNVVGATFDTIADTDGTTSQTFEIHVKHKLRVKFDATTLYNYIDYTGAANNPARVVQQAEVQHEYSVDDVTGQKVLTADETTYDLQNFTQESFRFNPDASTTGTTFDAATGAVSFPTVSSPELAGYTVDKPSVTITMPYDAENTELHQTVTYTPIVGEAVVHFVDTTDPSNLLPDVQVPSGVASEAIDFSTVNTTLASCLAKGYVVVANETTDGTVDTNFDFDTTTKQYFTISLAHGHKVQQQTITFTERVYSTGGYLTDPVNLTQSASVIKTYTQDLVTKKEVADSASYSLVSGDGHLNNVNGSYTFNAVQVPSFDGFTQDMTEVPAVTVTTNNPKIEIPVTYTPITQHGTLHIFDDTTGEELGQTAVIGDPNTTLNFELNADLNSWLVENLFTLISEDGTDTPEQKYIMSSTNIGDFVWDDDDTAQQDIEIHLQRKLVLKTVTQTVTGTVNYVGAKQNPDAVVQTAVVTHTYLADAVSDDEVETPELAAKYVPADFVNEYVLDSSNPEGVSLSTDGLITFTPVVTPELADYSVSDSTVTLTTKFTQPNVDFTVIYIGILTSGTSETVTDSFVDESHVTGDNLSSEVPVHKGDTATAVSVVSAGVLPNTAVKSSAGFLGVLAGLAGIGLMLTNKKRRQ